MKKLPISKFELGIIIAFVVIGLLGGGAWYYLSGQLANTQQDVGAAKTDFDKNSISQGIVVSHSNQKTLLDDIAMLKSQLTPLIQDKLQSKDSKLSSIDRKDPVAWKHDLDNKVNRLTKAAKVHGVKLPPDFYFAFSRYLNQNPDDEETDILSKQLLAIEEIANILINAPVKDITSIRRTYEEEPHSTGSATLSGPDRLAGFSISIGDGVYTDYPYEVEFDANVESLRKILDDLIQSPYVFIVRSLTVENSQPTSPLLSSLDQIAGTTTPSVIDSSPGEVAATTSVKGPQYLFTNSPLHVKARIDLIEWNTPAPQDAAAAGSPDNKPSPPGGNG